MKTEGNMDFVRDHSRLTLGVARGEITLHARDGMPISAAYRAPVKYSSRPWIAVQCDDGALTLLLDLVEARTLHAKLGEALAKANAEVQDDG